MKTCNKCNLEKELSMFYVVDKKKNRRHGACKLCIREIERVRYLNTPEYSIKRKTRVNEKKKQNPEKFKLEAKERSTKHYMSIEGRAKSLLKTTKRESAKFKELPEIDLDFITRKLNLGVCEVTGILFDFEKHETYSKNPFSPSIDRIDSNIGYTKENTRLVIWQLNLMKGEISDQLLLQLCRILIDRHEK